MTERALQRGRYDRRMAPDARARAHRGRLLDAAAAALAETSASLSVAGVAARAGVGRNTLYRHFVSVAALREAVEEQCAAIVASALAAAVAEAATPTERLRAPARAWMRLVLERPQVAALVLRERADGERPIDAALGAALSTAGTMARADGALGAVPDELRIAAVAAALAGAARHLLRRGQAQRAEQAGAVMADLVVRALR